jgi:hypothetical protein
LNEDCPERIDLGFWWYVLRWKDGPGPSTEKQLKDYEGTLLRLRNPRELERWLATLVNPLAAN